MKTLWSWIKGLFAVGSRNTSIAGVATLVGAAATGYGMSTGVVPITPGTVGSMASATATGLGLLVAKDGNGTPAPIQALGEAGAQAQQLDPLYAPIKSAVEAAGDAAKIQAALAAAAAITQMGVVREPQADVPKAAYAADEATEVPPGVLAPPAGLL